MRKIFASASACLVVSLSAVSSLGVAQSLHEEPSRCAGKSQLETNASRPAFYCVDSVTQQATRCPLPKAAFDGLVLGSTTCENGKAVVYSVSGRQETDVQCRLVTLESAEDLEAAGAARDWCTDCYACWTGRWQGGGCVLHRFCGGRGC